MSRVTATLAGRGRHGRTNRRVWAATAAILVLVAGFSAVTVGNASRADASTTATGWAQISAGGNNYSCALTSAGAAYCWGSNSSGQLGNGTGSSSNTPVKVPLPAGATSWSTISTGYTTACAVTSDGVAYCWGFNGSGQLGNGTTTNANTPVEVTPPTTNTKWSTISAGGSTTCALTTTNDAYCWGENGWGQIGNGSTTDANTPVEVTPPTTNTKWSVITAHGDGHTCALTTTKTAYCWGSNGSGQLGNGNTTNANTPVEVTPPTTNTKWSAITTASAGTTCALTTTKAAYCWGHNGSGQLGNGHLGTDENTPVAVIPPATDTKWSTISDVGGTTCALTTTSAAYCWGGNYYGQIGNGSNTYSNTPVEVTLPATDTKWSAISTGSGTGHTCALTTTHTAYCWGHNDSGQLGNGNTGTDENTPVAVVKVTQSISFTAPSDTALTSGPVDVSGDASTDSGLAVTVTSNATSMCTVSGMSVVLHKVGTCSLTASQPGDGAFKPATSVTRTFQVTMGTQAPLTVTSTSGIYATPLLLTTTGGSGTGAVSYTVGTGGTATGCTISSGTLTSAGVGTCVVTATKAADTNYYATSSPATTITLTKANQTALTITSTSGTYGTPLALTTSGGSGTGPVSYALGTNGTATGCAINPSNELTSTSAGTCAVTATKAADANFNATSSPATTITLAKADQAPLTITSTSGTYGTPLILTATGGTGTGAIAFTTTDGTATGCAISGGTLTSTGAGTCMVTATNAADTNYNEASTTTSIALAKAATTTSATWVDPIEVGHPASVTATVITDAPDTPTGTILVTDTTDSTITATGSLDASGTATIDVEGLTLGSHDLTVDYAGDANHEPSTATITVQITTADATLTGVPGDTTPGDQIEVTATGFNPGETVTFTLHSTPMVLGTATADAYGTAIATLTIPDQPGEHTITATGDTSETSVDASTTIAEPPAPPTTTTPTTTAPAPAPTHTDNGTGTGRATYTDEGTLPATGSPTAPLTGGAFILITLGAIGIALERRRTT